MQILVSNVRIYGGRLIATIDNSFKITEVTKFCNKDKNVLDILPYFQKRSIGKKSQNNHIWGHAKQIASEQGLDYRALEYEARCRAISRGLRQEKNPKTDEPALDLHSMPVPIPLAKVDMHEANMIIEELHMIAGFLEIALIEGDEYLVENVNLKQEKE